MQNEKIQNWKFDLIAMAIILVIGFSILTPRIGSYGFWDPWEPKYTESVKEMKEIGTTVTPYYLGEIRFTKPILVYWGIWISSLLFGLNEFGARFASNIVALLCAAAVYFSVSRFRSRSAGLIAALILLTSPQFFCLGKQATTDIYLASFLGAAAAFFGLALFGNTKKDWPFILAYASMSLAFLAKGPLAIIIAMVPLFVYLATSFDYSVLVKPPLASHTVRSLLVLTPIVLFAFFMLFLTVLGGAPTRWWYDELPQWLAKIRFALLQMTGLSGDFDDPTIPPIFTVLFSLMILASAGAFAYFFRKYLLTPGNEDFKEKSIRFFRQCLIFFIVFLVVAGPWHAAIFIKHGGLYIREFIGKHNLHREVVEVSDHGGKSDYYFRAVMFGMFPWSALIPAALLLLISCRSKEIWKEQGPEIFFLIWFATIFAFFSQATTKFYHYLVPAVPVLAILLGLFLSRYLAGESPMLFRIAFFFSLIFSLVLHKDMVTYKLEYLVNTFTVKLAVPVDVVNLGVYRWLFLAWALSLIVLLVLKKSRIAVMLSILAAFAFSIYVSDFFLVKLAPHKTLKPHCEAFYRLKGDQLALYGKTKHSCIYYSNREITMLGENPKAFLEFMSGGKRSFCIINRQDLRDTEDIIRKTGMNLYRVKIEHFDYLLLTNTPYPGETGQIFRGN